MFKFSILLLVSLLCKPALAQSPATVIGMGQRTAGVYVYQGTNIGAQWANGIPDANGCIRRQFWSLPSRAIGHYEEWCPDPAQPGDLRLWGWTSWDNQQARWVYIELWVGETRGQPYYRNTTSAYSFMVAVEMRVEGRVAGHYLDFHSWVPTTDRKSTRLNSSHVSESRMPSSA